MRLCGAVGFISRRDTGGSTLGAPIGARRHACDPLELAVEIRLRTESGVQHDPRDRVRRVQEQPAGALHPIAVHILRHAHAPRAVDGTRDITGWTAKPAGNPVEVQVDVRYISPFCIRSSTEAAITRSTSVAALRGTGASRRSSSGDVTTSPPAIDAAAPRTRSARTFPAATTRPECPPPLQAKSRLTRPSQELQTGFPGHRRCRTRSSFHSRASSRHRQSRHAGFVGARHSEGE